MCANTHEQHFLLPIYEFYGFVIKFGSENVLKDPKHNTINKIIYAKIVQTQEVRIASPVLYILTRLSITVIYLLLGRNAYTDRKVQNPQLIYGHSLI